MRQTAVRTRREVETKRGCLHTEQTAKEGVLQARIGKERHRRIKIHVLLAKRLEEDRLLVKPERVADLKEKLPDLVAEFSSCISLVREAVRFFQLTKRESETRREVKDGGLVLRQLVIGFKSRAVFFRISSAAHRLPQIKKERIFFVRAPSRHFHLLHQSPLPSAFICKRLILSYVKHRRSGG